MIWLVSSALSGRKCSNKGGHCEAQRAALQDMTTAMVNKMLHGPISNLKKSSPEDDEDGTLYVAALKKLFNLEDK